MVCVNQEWSCILYLYICQGSSYGNLVAAPTAKFQFTRQQSIQLNRRNYVATPASLVEAVRTTLSSVTNEAAAQVLNTEFKWSLRVWYQYIDHNWDFYHRMFQFMKNRVGPSISCPWVYLIFAWHWCKCQKVT